VAATTLLSVEGSKEVLKLQESLRRTSSVRLRRLHHVRSIRTFNMFVSCNLALSQGLL
jgi:hypothetical protein